MLWFTRSLSFYGFAALLLLSPTHIYAKIRHPISIPEFDDNDTIEFISLDGSITNFFNNKGVVGARPDQSSAAYNRYDFDLQIERKDFFSEVEVAFLTDRYLEPSTSRMSEYDINTLIGYHLNHDWDIYIEHESYTPFNHTQKTRYDGIGLIKNISSTFFGSSYNFLIDLEKIFNPTHFSPTLNGSGEGKVNTIYSLHFDYDLPSNFSFSTQHDFYTIDKKNNTFNQKFYQIEEWDQLYQLNYQMSFDMIISLFHEIDTYMTCEKVNQNFSGIQLLYEF